ncbi:MAG: ATP-binding cassette domain-containing protein, partial [Chloroflexota bacterium]
MTVSASAQEHAAVAGVAALEVTGLSAGYRQTAALQDVSFTVPRGSLLAVVGPNGAGKSTLFKVILGLVAPWKGSVHVLGRPVREA